MIYVWRSLGSNCSVYDIIVFSYGQNYPSILPSLRVYVTDVWTPLVLAFFLGRLLRDSFFPNFHGNEVAAGRRRANQP